ncbi:MAG: phenylacetate--CoA ligase family protein [Candidatus Abyssobacteria bacterium SURF_5]|uniref:Phenylacetate--CoA ligase family protein n=1 Tax=Abyssobacteria bacterium (strain SURF_5) TaxID=2093360 RepID=A0A3A4P626_ABYX5|nr:MAG: phenylacetate--CoA ligase family protein [Candidatus Abyssubacteria bacterium SURF_5]
MQRVYERLYSLLPPFAQSLLVTLYAVRIHLERYGPEFREQLEELEKTQWLSSNELAEYQNQKLQLLVEHAYENVPYYRRLMDQRKLDPADIKTSQDLRKLPVLTRDDVRKHKHELLSSAYRKKQLAHGHTSGTTGSPLEFFWDRKMCAFNNAAYWRQARWAGLRYGDKFAVALGRIVCPTTRKKPPFWRMNYLDNQLWISSFHLNEENLPCYIRKLREFKPMALECYPSTGYIIAKYLESRRETLPLKAVLTSSETLFPFQKETIEKSFDCRVYDYYGMAERVVFATECDRHEGRHLNLEYGICEILDSDGIPVVDGKEGYVVGTSLHNYAMPFIRYQTSDISAIRKKSCSCGRALPLIQDVTTKAEDIIVTPAGNLISPSVLTHPFKPLKTIKMSQIIQDRVDHILIKIVAEPRFSRREANALLVEFRKRVGSDMQVDLQEVSEIPRTAAGKFKWVISTAPINFKHEKQRVL